MARFPIDVPRTVRLVGLVALRHRLNQCQGGRMRSRARQTHKVATVVQAGTWGALEGPYATSQW